MAFMVYQTDDGHIPGWEYYNAVGLTPKVGMALNLSGGKLVAATSGKPQYICMREQKEAVTEDKALIPVIHVDSSIIFEVSTAASLSVGASVVTGADSVSVAAGTGGGTVMEVVETGVVRVRF